MRKSIYLVFVILLMLGGCTTVTRESKVSLSLPMSSKTIDDIDVYTSHESIEKSYKEIDLLRIGYSKRFMSEPELSSELLMVNESELLERLIPKAKEIGADGIIILSVEQFIQRERGVLDTSPQGGRLRVVIQASAITYGD